MTNKYGQCLSVQCRVKRFKVMENEGYSANQKPISGFLSDFH